MLAWAARGVCQVTRPGGCCTRKPAIFLLGNQRFFCFFQEWWTPPYLTRWISKRVPGRREYGHTKYRRTARRLQSRYTSRGRAARTLETGIGRGGDGGGFARSAASSCFSACSRASAASSSDCRRVRRFRSSCATNETGKRRACTAEQGTAVSLGGHSTHGCESRVGETSRLDWHAN